jgi:flagellum-specific peptidoglycan hydrolase FlgJ
MTGFAFAHGTVDDMTSPSRMPVHLLALTRPARPASANDGALRSAVVNVANNYLRMAQSKSPADMEGTIWAGASVDGADHGESCAAFASLTLQLGAQVVGQQSWVTGGATYPWPLHQWADVRVDPNPASPGITSILQDAQAHQRWHPLGDGYHPQPGDWVMFDGHVEVVTRYSAGVLYTIGGDSLPNLSVNAHTYTDPLAAQGVAGFVNNGELLSMSSPAASGAPASAAPASASASVAAASGSGADAYAGGGSASDSAATDSAGSGSGGQATSAGGQGQGPATAVTASVGQAAIPGTRTATLTASGGRSVRTGTADGHRAAGRGGTASMLGTAGGVGGVGTVGTASMVAVPGTMAGAGTVAGTGAAAASGPGDGAGRAAARNGTAPRAGAAPRGGTAQGGGTAQRGGTGARAGSGGRAGSGARNGTAARAGSAGRNGATTRTGSAQRTGTAAIPGLQAIADNISGGSAAPAAPSYTRHNPPAAAAHVPETAAQQAFISQVSPGAMAAQSRYGVPAAVTIAQAIDESGWGQSALAIRDYNLFGIKGNGPAGSDMQPTQEFQNGSWVTVTAGFRVYHNVAESIADHGQLLATGPDYQRAMADRHVPDAFATDLTGVYATDPQYGANLIAIMRLYNLYQYGSAAPAAPQMAAQAGVGVPGTSANQGGTVSKGETVSQGGTGLDGGATIPGVLDAYIAGPARHAPTAEALVTRTSQAGGRPAARVAPRSSRAGARTSRYVPQIPRAVTTAFITTAKAPLSRAQPLYADVASHSGIRWQLLAACDWMQCQAQPRYSPVHGEKLGTANADGTIYRTKSEALAQCASDLIELAMAVYWIDITARRPLSVRDLAKVFAAFRWGGLLKLHGISAMEFPYSVEGLTAQHVKMRWPDVKDRNPPDKPGARFRMPFGAVPVVLSLDYPATA